jgi:Carboxypeptidase regulatory-like domain
MQAFHKALAALLLCACWPAYAGVRVDVERGEVSGPLEVRIGLPQEDDTPKWIEAKRIPAGASSVAFDAIVSGTYVILLSGEGPLERFAMRTGIRGEGDEVIRVTLPKPRPIRGAVRLGEKPAGDVILSFRNGEFAWVTSLTAAPDGTFAGAAWQPGEYSVSGRGGVLTSPVRRKVRIEGEALTIDLSPLRITGVVSDPDGAPVPEARVRLRAESGRETSNISILTDRHGMFEFSDVKQGPYALSVLADGYLIANDHPVFVTGETTAEKVGITMQPGVARPLRIVDAAGKPVPSAAVHVISDAQLRSTTMTDVEGRATVSIPSSGSSAAWVIPQAGSFAVVRLDPKASGETMNVVVPEGSASVSVNVITPAHAGVSGVGLLMRYNGEILIPGVFSLSTDDHGHAKLVKVPPGFYEFWPYMAREEAAQLLEAQAFSPARAPIAVEAAEGESRATVVVQKKDSSRGVVQ